MNVPIFKDVHTPSPFLEPIPEVLNDATKEQLEYVTKWSTSNNLETAPTPATPTSLPQVAPDALPDHIYMDCMCFGMGCSCLQITFQACSIEEARKLYDQLAGMSPIMVHYF